MSTTSVEYTTSTYSTAIADYVASPSEATEAEVQDSISSHLKDMNDKALSDLAIDPGFASQISSWKSGSGGDAYKTSQLASSAYQFDPSELQAAADNGLISQDQADALIMLGALKGTGLTDDAINKAMGNYFQLPSDDQQNIAEEMSSRTVTPKFEWTVTANGDGTNDVKVNNLAYVSSLLSSDQKDTLNLLAQNSDFSSLTDTKGLAALDSAISGWQGTSYQVPADATAYAQSLTKAFSPDEINAAANAGLISRDEASAAIIVSALSAKGCSGPTTGMVMSAFFRMSPADQQTVITALSKPGTAQDSMIACLTNQKNTWHSTSDFQVPGYNNLPAAMDAWSKGAPISQSSVDQITDLAGQYSPQEIQSAVPRFLTQELANMTIVVSGLKNAGLSGDEINQAMENFYKLSPEDQQYVVDKMSDRTTTGSIFGNVTDPNDFSNAKLTFTSSPATAEQTKIGLFLVNTPADQLTGIQDFVTTQTQNQGVPDTGSPTSREDITNYLAANIDGWDSYTPEEQNALVDEMVNETDPDVSVDADGNYVKPATDASGNVVTGADGQPQTVVVGKPLTADDMRGLGIPDADSVDIGTLMFLVLMDRMQSQDDLIRGYTEDVDKKNQDLKNATAAQAALRACNADSGDVDITDTYFTNQSGDEVSVYDYCKAYGIDIPQDSNGNAKTSLNSTEMDNLLTSMKSYSDTLSTDAQSALQKLQQATDRYSNTNSLLTNFESAWRSMLKEVIGNIRA